MTLGAGLQRGLGALLMVALLALADRQGGLGDARVIGVASALAMAASSLSDFGTTPATLRDFAMQAPTRQEFLHVLLLKLGSGVLVAAALAGAALVVAPGELGLGVCAAAMMLPLLGATSAATSKLVADGAGTRLGLAAGTGFVAGVAAALAGAVLDASPVVMLLALPVGRLVEAAVLILGLQFPPTTGVRSAYDLAWLARSWPLATYWFLSAAYLRGQVLAPAVVLAASQGGEVAQGFTVYSAGTLLPGAVAVAAAPTIARAVQRSPRMGLRTALRLSGLSTLMSAPVTAGMILLAEPGLTILYGEPSDALVAYVRWGALAALFVAPNSLLLSFMVAMGRGVLIAALWALTFAVSTAYLVWLSDTHEVAGAGLAVALSEATLFVVLVLAASALTVLDRRPSFAGRRRTLAAAVLPSVALLALAAGLAAPFAAENAAFPGRDTGLLALFALPVFIFLGARWFRYDLFAPAVVFAIPWTLALAIAQLPLYPSLEWHRETWLLVSLPPLALAGGALVAAGPASARARDWGGLPTRFSVPLAPLALFAAIGTAAWVRFFLAIGSVPLLSGRIDAVRFSEFDGPTLVGTRFGYVGLVFAIFGMAVTRQRGQRLFYAACAAACGAPLILTGGRLYFISACFAGLFAGVLVRGINRKSIMAVAAAGFAFLAFSTALWFARLDQQESNPFKSYLENSLVQSRPEWLRWSIPSQLAAAGSFITLNDLVDADLYQRYEGDGYYSTKALDRFVAAKDLEVPARASSPYGQVTTTFVGPWFADFGLPVTCALAALLGTAMGALYRAMRARPGSAVLIVGYSYAAFWLVFDIYLNYWSLHGVWLADLPLILLFGRLCVPRTAPVAQPEREPATSLAEFAGAPGR